MHLCTIEHLYDEKFWTEEFHGSFLSEAAENNNLQKRNDDDSKLIVKNEYEGGGTTWECSNDLKCWIYKQNWKELKERKDPVFVLELGCGIATPSLELFKKLPTAKFVLQDLNAEVLTTQTVCTFSKHPNCSKRLLQSSWKQMSETKKKPANQFDLIHSSESCYREENFTDLEKVLDLFLKPRGQIIFAQKRFYFGVGGGSLPFKKFLNDVGKWNVEVLEEFVDGLTNVRDILLITRKDSSMSPVCTHHPNG